jgi:hypothetical protein
MYSNQILVVGVLHPVTNIFVELPMNTVPSPSQVKFFPFWDEFDLDVRLWISSFLDSIFTSVL